MLELPARSRMAADKRCQNSGANCDALSDLNGNPWNVERLYFHGPGFSRFADHRAAPSPRRKPQ